MSNLWLYPFGFLIGGVTVLLPFGYDFLSIAIGAIVLFYVFKKKGEL